MSDNPKQELTNKSIEYRIDIDLLYETRLAIERKISRDGERALEMVLAERGYVKQRTCRPIKNAYTYLPATDCPAWECSECGELFEEGARYCSQCGAKVVEQ